MWIDWRAKFFSPWCQLGTGPALCELRTVNYPAVSPSHSSQAAVCFIVVLSSYNLLHGLKKKDFSAHITTVFALETLCFFHETELLTKHLSFFELFFCWSPPALISNKPFWLDFTVFFHNLLTYFNTCTSFCSRCTCHHSDSQTIPASMYIQKNLKACVHLLVVFRS